MWNNLLSHEDLKPEYQTTVENAEDAVYILQYQILS